MLETEKESLATSNDSRPMLWKWVCIGLGILLTVTPFLQAYIAVKPHLILLQFIPLEAYMKEMLPVMLLGNASILCGIVFFVGGLLLVFGKRWGYVLSVAACGFTLVSLLETMAVFTVILSKAGQETVSLYAEEAYEWMGLFPVYLAVLVVAALVLLNLKTVRAMQRIGKKEVWTAFFIGLFLIVDMNVCFLLSVSGGVS